MLEQIEFTEKDFMENYFFYIGNNSPFVQKTLISDHPTFDILLNKIKNRISLVTSSIKVGIPNFISDYDDSEYFIFKLDNDIFYYRICVHGEGNTIGILIESKEHIWQNAENLCDKCVNFLLELNKHINE